MNYLKHYCALMRKASDRNWKKGRDPYFEKHHMWGKVGHRKGMKNKPPHCEGISNTRCEIFGNVWEVTDPDGNKYVCKSLKKFAKEHSLNAGHMYNIAKGKLKQYKGWTVENVKNHIV